MSTNFLPILSRPLLRASPLYSCFYSRISCPVLRSSSALSTPFRRAKNNCFGALFAPVLSSRLPDFARRTQRIVRELESAYSEAKAESEADKDEVELKYGAESEEEVEVEAGKFGGEKRRVLESGRLELGNGGIGLGKKSQRVAQTSLVATMGGMLDLEEQFSFYGAYHSNKVNIFIHILFVWPILYTSMILWAYTPALAPLPLGGGTLPFQEYMVLNGSFILAAVYALYYIALDRKAGSLGAAICLGCWMAANAVAQALPWSLAWKIVLVSQVTCWAGQIFGHLKYEGRAPALLDNLAQAFLMAPFFVLLECLQSFGYEPYPGFHKKVQKNVEESIRKFRASKEKKSA